MKEYIEEMTSRKNTLMVQIEYLENDAVMADGQAHYEIKRKIAKAWNEVNHINLEIDRFTFVGPRMPEWVRNQRHHEHVEVERKGRIQSAMKKIEQLFGGKSGNTNY